MRRTYIMMRGPVPVMTHNNRQELTAWAQRLGGTWEIHEVTEAPEEIMDHTTAQEIKALLSVEPNRPRLVAASLAPGERG